MRLDDDVIARIDALREALSTEWHEITRSEVLRLLIEAGLDDYDKRVVPASRRCARTAG